MANVTDYYYLIPPPNSVKPKFMAWVTVMLQLLVDAINVNMAMPDAFHINMAVGVQLDTIGAILNRPRLLPFTPTTAGASPLLDDPTYRLVLKAKILQNQWKGTKNELYDFYDQNLPYTIIIHDNQDMTMSVLVLGMPAGLLRELVQHGYFVPKPAGVLVNYSFTDNTFYGYDSNTGYVHGYDDGGWA